MPPGRADESQGLCAQKLTGHTFGQQTNVPQPQQQSSLAACQLPQSHEGRAGQLQQSHYMAGRRCCVTAATEPPCAVALPHAAHVDGPGWPPERLVDGFAVLGQQQAAACPILAAAVWVRLAARAICRLLCGLQRGLQDNAAS